MNGYKINFATNTITMNYKFAAATEQYGTNEYNLIKGILADFPTMKRIVKAGREITTPRPYKRLTYANMGKYISAFANSDELLEIFETVKTLSAPLKSPYKYVRTWFELQFPEYKNIPDLKNGVLVAFPISAPSVDKFDFTNAG